MFGILPVNSGQKTEFTLDIWVERAYWRNLVPTHCGRVGGSEVRGSCSCYCLHICYYHGCQHSQAVTGHRYTYTFGDLLSQHNSGWKMAPIFLPNCMILADHMLHPKPYMEESEKCSFFACWPLGYNRREFRRVETGHWVPKDKLQDANSTNPYRAIYCDLVRFLKQQSEIGCLLSNRALGDTLCQTTIDGFPVGLLNMFVTSVSCLLNNCFHCIETFLLTFVSQSMVENRLCWS